MIDEETARIYQQEGLRWTESRSAMHSRAVEWINAERRSGPILDLGTGPGWHLALCRAPAVGVDIASAMLELARTRTDHPLVNASAGRLPFGRQTVGGAIASRVYNHLHLTDNPMALADLHRCLQPGAPVLFHFLGFPDGIRLETGEEGADSPGETDNQGGTDSLHVGFDTRSGPPFAGRLSSLWTETGLADLMEGAGFEIMTTESDAGGGRVLQARRRFSLPDTVGADMRLLICGLNPSPTAAEMGVGFGRPGNRFWPAATAAGLVTVDRDPFHALYHHGLGMTDLVKRTTRRAADLTVDEYRNGLARVERLVRWLQPGAVCFVGLAGWRVAVDRAAVAGRQEIEIGGRPVYVMPSTSGLNANSRLDDLIEHLRAAAKLAAQG